MLALQPAETTSVQTFRLETGMVEADKVLVQVLERKLAVQEKTCA